MAEKRAPKLRATPHPNCVNIDRVSDCDIAFLTKVAADHGEPRHFVWHNLP